MENFKEANKYTEPINSCSGKEINDDPYDFPLKSLKYTSELNLCEFESKNVKKEYYPLNPLEDFIVINFLDDTIDRLMYYNVESKSFIEQERITLKNERHSILVLSLERKTLVASINR